MAALPEEQPAFHHKSSVLQFCYESQWRTANFIKIHSCKCIYLTTYYNRLFSLIIFYVSFYQNGKLKISCPFFVENVSQNILQTNKFYFLPGERLWVPAWKADDRVWQRYHHNVCRNIGRSHSRSISNVHLLLCTFYALYCLTYFTA